MPDPTLRLDARPRSLRPPAAILLLRRRVLVVEDEYVLAQDLAHELEDMGAEVLGPVPGVAQALALLAAEDSPPDAAILDVNLGGEMVYPVAEALRVRGVPFAFATGYDASAIPQAYAHVLRCEKPFDVGRCLGVLLGAT